MGMMFRRQRFEATDVVDAIRQLLDTQELKELRAEWICEHLTLSIIRVRDHIEIEARVHGLSEDPGDANAKA